MRHVDPEFLNLLGRLGELHTDLLKKSDECKKLMFNGKQPTQGAVERLRGKAGAYTHAAELVAAIIHDCKSTTLEPEPAEKTTGQVFYEACPDGYAASLIPWWVLSAKEQHDWGKRHEQYIAIESLKDK